MIKGLSTIISVAAVSTSIAVMLFIIKVLFPYSPEDTKRSFEDLKKEYYKWHLFFGALFIIFFSVLSYLWYRLFIALEQFSLSEVPGLLFAILPSKYFWMLIALVVAFATFGAPTHYFIKNTFLGEKRYKEYFTYSNMNMGFNDVKIYKILALPIVIIASVAISLAGDTYTCFTENKIIVDSFWAFDEKTYAYADVDSIYHVSHTISPAGNIRKSPHYVLKFSDLKYWSTCEGLRDPVPERDAKVIEFLVKKTGLKIITAKLDPWLK
ncbi:MAG: hypothetical protein ABIK92_11130 [Pseudomonadota bacterium]